MGTNKSSFHMGDEINGYGQQIILKADPITLPPVSQENVRLTPNFNEYVAKIIFSIPVINVIDKMDVSMLKMMSAQVAVNQVIISNTAKNGTDQVPSYDFQMANSNAASGGALLTAFGSTVSSDGNKKEGWYKEDGYWVYYKNNKKQKSRFIDDGGHKYYLDWKGHMVTGLREDWGKKYYFKPDGRMVQNNFVEIDDAWYYFDADGLMVKKDFVIHKGKTYYLDKEGQMLTGQQKIGKKTYYFDSSGAMYKGQMILDGEQSYFDENGERIKLYAINDFLFMSSDDKNQQKEDENTAIELMRLHQFYHDHVSQVNYATKGSILACTYGTIINRLDETAPTDISDIGTGLPILGCNSCKPGENINSFYKCRSHSTTDLPMRPVLEGGVKCIPILNESWIQEGNAPIIWNSVNGKTSRALKADSVISCRYGGLIGILEVPEKEPEGLTLERCIQEMENYLQTGELNDDIITWMAENGNAIINNFESGEFLNNHNDTVFHEEILAWTAFWNYRINNYTVNPYPYKTAIRANVVKAIIAQESSMGTVSPKNSTRNIMGCLFAGDPSLWIAAAFNPLVEGKYHFDSDGEPAISARLLDGTYEWDATLIEQYFPSETKTYRFGTGFRFLDPVILKSGGGTSRNEFLIEYNAMTVRMGLAIGIGVLAYKINVNADGSEKNGVMGYGTGDGYEVIIDGKLKELGAGTLQ